MATTLQDLVSLFATTIVSELERRIGPTLRATNGHARVVAPALNGARKRGGQPGSKRDMACRIPGCKERSKGPRYGYICEGHLALPARQRKEAAQDYKRKHAG